MSTPDDLYGYLAGQFADAALLGQTNEQAAVAGVSAETKTAAADVLTQGRAVLASPSFDWESIGDYANRRFKNEAEARTWLTRMMDLLEAAIQNV